MMEKVKITREVANGIESVRTGFEDARIIEIHSQFPNAWSGPSATNLNGLPLLTLVDALRVGYEVEERFEVGDWVVYINHRGEKFVGKVEESLMDGFLKTDMYMGCKVKQAVEPHTLRHATPEEIKAEQERRVWAGIGREVGEFKANDVFIDKKGMPFIFAGVTHLSSGIITLKTAYEWHRIGNFKGLYPAESFIELGGESHDN